MVDERFISSAAFHKASVSIQYITSAIIWNFRTCMHKGDQIGCYFEFSQPFLSQYENYNYNFRIVCYSVVVYMGRREDYVDLFIMIFIKIYISGSKVQVIV